MRELELFSQYLIRLRQEKLQLGHMSALTLQDEREFIHVSNRAHEAELCQRIADALKLLEKDPGQFIAQHLQWREP